MFVVGTVLYRNLGSFLALQRWAPWGYGGRPGLGEMGMLGVEATGVQGCQWVFRKGVQRWACACRRGGSWVPDVACWHSPGTPLS